MKQLINHGFNRRYVLLPVLASVALLVCAFFLTEARRFTTRELVQTSNEQQEFMISLTELIGAVSEAESAQRGFLLTGYDEYLKPYKQATTTARRNLDLLVARLGRLDAAEAEELRVIGERLAGKLSEMETSIGMRRSGNMENAMSLMNSDVGLAYMQEIREIYDRLRARQQQRIGSAISEWDSSDFANTLVNLVTTVVMLLIVLVLGLLASREIGRRAWIANELESQVRERTSELRSLSEQLMLISETEKAALSRELHDELGGLLVAMKMDLSGLRRKLSLKDEDTIARWRRLETTIDAGVDLKRRVIENLRPTLLDNLGLIAALRWLAEERSAQAGATLELEVPEVEPEVPPDAAIAIFRVVQETFTNMLKHARAKTASMRIEALDGGIEIRITDDGIGISRDSLQKSGSHGLKQMQFRMTAIGGEVSTMPGAAGGTETVIRYVPAVAAAAAAAAAAGP